MSTAKHPKCHTDDFCDGYNCDGCCMKDGTPDRDRDNLTLTERVMLLARRINRQPEAKPPRRRLAGFGTLDSMIDLDGTWKDREKWKK